MTEKFTVTANNCNANSIKAEFVDVPKEKIDFIVQVYKRLFVKLKL